LFTKCTTQVLEKLKLIRVWMEAIRWTSCAVTILLSRSRTPLKWLYRQPCPICESGKRLGARWTK